MDADTLREKRGQNPVRDELAETGLYHSFELPDGRVLRGAMSLDWQRERLAAFGLPDDLHGKRVLDIGPWDGYYTFEMERRGADVTAIDYVDLDTFRELHRAFQSRARYERMDVYELDPNTMGTFDIVLCLGVLYHLKHPLLALERICAVTKDTCVIDTFVTDGEQWLNGSRSAMPSLEFYERAELAGQLDNWCGPNVNAIPALARAAGFAEAEIRRVTDTTATVAAYRHWHRLPPDDAGSIDVVAVTSHVHRGRTFKTTKEEYVEMWLASEEGTLPPLEQVYPELDGVGIAPLHAQILKTGLHTSFRLPPGVAAGRHEARIKIGRSQWSPPAPLYVDLPPLSNQLELAAVQDALTWASNEVDWSNGGWMVAWVRGLSEEADCGNTTVEIGGIPHQPEAIAPQGNQINVRLRPVIREGQHQARIIHREAVSNSLIIRVQGTPPGIRGLESLSLQH